MNNNIIVPVGPERGCQRSVEEIIGILMIEMLSHRSDLLLLRDQADEPDSMLEYQAQAKLLEKYAVAISSVYYQVRPIRPILANIRGLLELAKTHNVTLPDWMVIDEQPISA